MALLTTAVDQHSRASIRHRDISSSSLVVRSLDREEWSSLLISRTPAGPKSSGKQSGGSSGGTTKNQSNKSTGSKSDGATGQKQGGTSRPGPNPPQGSGRGSQGGAAPRQPTSIPGHGHGPPAQRQNQSPSGPGSGSSRIGGRVAGTSSSAFQKPSAPRNQNPSFNRPQLAPPARGTFSGGTPAGQSGPGNTRLERQGSVKPAGLSTKTKSNILPPSGSGEVGGSRWAPGVTVRQGQGQGPAASKGKEISKTGGGRGAGVEVAERSRARDQGGRSGVVSAGVGTRGQVQRDSRRFTSRPDDLPTHSTSNPAAVYPSTSSGSDIPNRRIVSGQPRFTDSLREWSAESMDKTF